MNFGDLIAKGGALFARKGADALADTLETAPPADLARIQSSVSGYNYVGTLADILSITTAKNGATALATGVGAAGYLILVYSSSNGRWKLAFDQMLVVNNTKSLGVGTPTPQVLASATLPAGVLSLGNAVVCDFLVERNNTSETPTIRLHAGSSSSHGANPAMLSTAGLNGGSRIRVFRSTLRKRSATSYVIAEDENNTAGYTGASYASPTIAVTLPHEMTGTSYISVIVTPAGVLTTPSVEYFRLRLEA